jgi:hypothetical protein
MSGCPDCERRARWPWWVAASVIVAAVLLSTLAGCATVAIELIKTT